ncbi:MAG: accessory factor UbiK family protein [Oceanobacter sp.]|jgi:BMFP domain-containing protein YqiC
MINPDIAQKIDSLLQQSPFAGLSQDLKLAMSSQLQALFTSANLVSREEFDAQQAVLERTLQQLSELEQRLVQLEGDATEDTTAPE